MTDLDDGATYLSRRYRFVECAVGMLNTILCILPEYAVSHPLWEGREVEGPRRRGSFA